MSENLILTNELLQALFHALISQLKYCILREFEPHGNGW